MDAMDGMDKDDGPGKAHQTLFVSMPSMPSILEWTGFSLSINAGSGDGQ